MNTLRLYFALCRAGDVGFLWKHGVHRFMASFYYLRHRSPGIRDRLAELRGGEYELFLDSGAWQGYQHGIEISLEELISTIREVQPDRYAVLDVIGDPKATLRNQRAMEAEGLSPLPVVHYGAPWSVWDWYADRYPEIGVGGLVPVRTPYVIQYLDHLFCRYPDHRFHLFGVTRPPVLLLQNRRARARRGLPGGFASADGATWSTISAWGPSRLPGPYRNAPWAQKNWRHIKLFGVRFIQALANLANDGGLTGTGVQFTLPLPAPWGEQEIQVQYDWWDRPYQRSLWPLPTGDVNVRRPDMAISLSAIQRGASRRKVG